MTQLGGGRRIKFNNFSSCKYATLTLADNERDFCNVFFVLSYPTDSLVSGCCHILFALHRYTEHSLSPSQHTSVRRSLFDDVLDHLSCPYTFLLITQSAYFSVSPHLIGSVRPPFLAIQNKVSAWLTFAPRIDLTFIDGGCLLTPFEGAWRLWIMNNNIFICSLSTFITYFVGNCHLFNRYTCVVSASNFP